MSIKLLRSKKAFFSCLLGFLRHRNSPSKACVCFPHFQHVFSIEFLKLKKRNKAFACFCKTISSDFSSIQSSPTRSCFVMMNGFVASKSFENPVNKPFRNTMHLKFDYIICVVISWWASSFADNKTSVSVNQSGKINKIFSADGRDILRIFWFRHICRSLFITSNVTQFGNLCPA